MAVGAGISCGIGVATGVSVGVLPGMTVSEFEGEGVVVGESAVLHATRRKKNTSVTSIFFIEMPPYFRKIVEMKRYSR